MGYNWLIRNQFLQISTCKQCSFSVGWVQTNQVSVSPYITLHVIDINSTLSTGNNAQEIQLINDGCPMFDFVTIQSHKGKSRTVPWALILRWRWKLMNSGPQIHFSTRVLRFRQDFSNDQINLGCSLTVKKTGEPPLCWSCLHLTS